MQIFTGLHLIPDLLTVSNNQWFFFFFFQTKFISWPNKQSNLQLTPFINEKALSKIILSTGHCTKINIAFTRYKYLWKLMKLIWYLHSCPEKGQKILEKLKIQQQSQYHPTHKPLWNPLWIYSSDESCLISSEHIYT